MRPLTLVFLLVLGTVPTARAQASEADAGVVSPVPCPTSDACAASRGRGWVCEEGECQPYHDATDLFVAVGLSAPSEAPPEAF